jgi:23S rRNA (uracil1939-C5)-methyltransferase
LEFFDLRKQTGFLRTLIIRTSTTGEVMIILTLFKEMKEEREKLLAHIKSKFPEITSLTYVINEKANDTITDQNVICYSGNDHIFEEMEGLKFKIGPKSFYQTNSTQAYELYKITRDFADLNGDELVYDLYTGTGTIANFVAKKAKHVVGVEYVPEAIEDAKVNSKLNKITNTSFFAGDMKDILNNDFIAKNGTPDVIITDPPRAGMHKDVVEKILEITPQKVVYVSCNPATQARDLQIMDAMYKVTKVQPVDMFPHTHHVENVVLLEKR